MELVNDTCMSSTQKVTNVEEMNENDADNEPSFLFSPKYVQPKKPVKLGKCYTFYLHFDPVVKPMICKE